MNWDREVGMWTDGAMTSVLVAIKPCMTDIYLHIDARMADYIRTHP